MIKVVAICHSEGLMPWNWSFSMIFVRRVILLQAIHRLTLEKF